MNWKVYDFDYDLEKNKNRFSNPQNLFSSSAAVIKAKGHIK